ncbi:MAG: hypothetical protein IJD80_04400, partial [Oscillospiraceae bacterium]|nr:hypothetical protein [Oscillospiraceae bacterium]
IPQSPPGKPQHQLRFLLFQKGFEPVRADTVKKTVRWTVFRWLSLSGSESQLVFAAGKDCNPSISAKKTAASAAVFAFSEGI